MSNILPIVQIEDNLFLVNINVEDILINKKEIGHSLGYEDGIIPPHFDGLVDDVISRLPTKCQIKAGYKILEVQRIEDRNDGFLIDGKFIHTKNIIASQFRKAEKVAIFVCTIGPEMESWSSELAKAGDGPLSYIVNAVASEAVEKATDLMHDLIGEQAKIWGLNITNRYSPGYCNWSVSEQHILFSFLPEKFCGITLTDSALMIPIKSISGIIGIGKEVKKMAYICDTCGVKDCTYRIILSRKIKK